LWMAPRWVVPTLAARSPGVLYFMPTAERVVALTVDDGPDASTTPAILEVLREYGARATFFLISERARAAEAVVAAIVRAGHELGNHLTRDEPSIRLGPRRFEAALTEAHEALSRAAPLCWARPGGGWYDRAMLDVMERHGYRCALGSVYPYDPHLPSARFAAAFILRHVHPGAVIVLHDGGRRGARTARTLRRVLPELARRGYRVTTLSDLVGELPLGGGE
jgi:peptidoglycan/xylan/chitin deacetylase (PgdA/CDA1 family)